MHHCSIQHLERNHRMKTTIAKYCYLTVFGSTFWIPHFRILQVLWNNSSSSKSLARGQHETAIGSKSLAPKKELPWWPILYPFPIFPWKMVTRLSDVSLRQPGFVEIQPGLDGYLGTKGWVSFQLAWIDLKKATSRLDQFHDESNQSYANKTAKTTWIVYIYSYPNLNVLLRPSFFFGLFLRQVRCFVPRILVAFFIPRSEVNGRVAVLQSWNLHLGSKQSGGEWWNMKTNWDETLLAEERKGTNFAKWCVYYLLDFFFQMCVLEWFEYGKRVIVVRRHEISQVFGHVFSGL